MVEEQAPQSGGMGVFEKYLTVWVGLCIIIGVAVGYFLPVIPDFLGIWEFHGVNIPVAILIWMMIYPMMLKVDMESIRDVKNHPQALVIVSVMNWMIKPFTMFGISYLFIRIIFSGLIPAELGTQYVAGAILLGAAPCTAMVFVWSYLTDGDAGYTLVQVALDNVVLLFAYAPIVVFLLGISAIIIPWGTVVASVVLYVVIPLAAGYTTRRYLTNRRGEKWFEEEFLPRFDNVTIGGLLLTLIILFSFQGGVILGNPLHILLIAVPLVIQSFFVFSIGYTLFRVSGIRHNIAAPGSMIGSSNFFELAVAVAISLFGIQSGAALATVVGVLVEVPVMLGLVAIANRTRHWFPTQGLPERMPADKR